MHRIFDFPVSFARVVGEVAKIRSAVNKKRSKSRYDLSSKIGLADVGSLNGIGPGMFLGCSRKDGRTKPRGGCRITGTGRNRPAEATHLPDRHTDV